MTISTTNNRKRYNGLTGQDTFAYDFRVDTKAQMEVYLAGVLEDPANWTITNLGNPGGGDVVLNSTLGSDQTVTLLRNVSMTQAVDYQPFDAFPAETHEQALDKLTMLVQQLQEQLDRVPLLGVDTALTGFDLGTPTANEIVAYNATEDGITATGKTIAAFNADVAAAAASASAASVSATNANTSANNASTSAGQASTSATAAAASAAAAAAAVAAGGYVAYGRVTSAGVVSKDNGLFTGSNDGTGLIGITFDATQSDADYVIMLTPEDGNARSVMVVPSSQDVDGFQIETENASGTAANSDAVFVLCIKATAWTDA